MVEKLRGLSSLFLVPIVLWGSSAIADGVSDAQPERPIYTRSLLLTSFPNTTVQLTNLSSGADAVVRVEYGALPGPYVNAQGPGGSETMVIPYTGQPATLIVHATGETTEGTGRLYINGKYDGVISFGGASTTYTAATDTKFFVGHSEAGYRTLQMLLTNCGSDWSAVSPLTETQSWYAGANHTEVYPNVSGCVRVVFSGRDPLIASDPQDPAYHPGLKAYASTDSNDGDGDGLSLALENALSTCDTNSPGSIHPVTGWLCSTYSSLDSDGDGISDHDEVYGSCSGSDCLALALWGAVASQKDAFAEIDFEQGSDALPTGDRAASNTYNAVQQGAAAYLAGSATSLKNPNGIDGLRVHFDMNFSSSPALETFSIPGNRVVVFDSNNSETITTCDLWENKFLRPQTDHSKLFFRYGCESAQSRGSALDGSNAFRFHVGSWALMIHELGHNLQISHGGDNDRSNVSVHRLSSMSYAYQNHRFLFSSGLGNDTTIPDAINPTSLCEETPFGPNATVDGSEIDFALQQTSWGASWVPQRYPVNSSGQVDWNRDGVISPCSTPVEAPIRWNDEGSSFNHHGFRQTGIATYPTPDAQNPTNTDIWGPATVVYVNGNGVERIYVFYVKDVNGADAKRIAWRWMDFTNTSCTVAPHHNEPCNTFSSETITGYPASSVDAVYRDGWIYLASRYENGTSINNGRIATRRFQPQSGGGSGIGAQQSLSWSTTDKANGRPVVLAEPGGGHSIFYRRESDDRLAHVRYDNADVIIASGLLPTSGASYFASRVDIDVDMNDDDGSPYIAIQSAPAATIQFIKRIYGSWASATQYVLPSDPRFNVKKNISIEFRPNSRTSTDKNGAFWLFYGVGTSGTVYETRFDGSTAAGRLVTGKRRWTSEVADNERLGFDTEYIPGFGVVGVQTYRDTSSAGYEKLRLLPYAVEIMDQDFGDYHDYANMDSCIGLLRNWNDLSVPGHAGCGDPNVVPISPPLVDWGECGEEQ